MQPWHYILLVGAVIFIGGFIMPRNKSAAALPNQTVQNMEIALEQFMENMEKDNDELVQLVANVQASLKQEAEQKDKRIAALEKRCELLERQLQKEPDRPAPAAPPAEAEVRSSAVSAGAAPVQAASAAPDSSSIQVRYAELFQLYKQGKSIEAIARKLAMNKGEVQLIIQLAKKEDRAHVQ